MSSTCNVADRQAHRNSLLWLTAIAGFVVFSSAALVEAKPGPDAMGSADLDYWSRPGLSVASKNAGQVDRSGFTKVAGKIGKVVKGAAAGAAVKRGRDKQEQSEGSSESDTLVDQPVLGGPQPIELPKPMASPAPASPAVAAPAAASAKTGIEASAVSGCVAGCGSPVETRAASTRVGQAKARGQAATKGEAVPATPVQAEEGIMCFAGCGGAATVLPRTSSATGAPALSNDNELRTTTTEGSSRVTVLRGVTRAKVYGVSR